MSKFHKGQTALVVNAMLPENIGQEVVVHWTTDAVVLELPDGRCHYNHDHSRVCVVEGQFATKNMYTRRRKRVQFGVFPESWLMPLSGHVADIHDAVVVGFINTREV